MVSTSGLISTRVHSFSQNTLYNPATTVLHSSCPVLPGVNPSDVARCVAVVRYSNVQSLKEKKKDEQYEKRMKKVKRRRVNNSIDERLIKVETN